MENFVESSRNKRTYPNSGHCQRVERARNSTSAISSHLYIKCRSIFTMKKLLYAITRKPSSSAFENAEEGTSRRVSRGVPSTSRVYDELCIFCVKSSKYQKGQNTREPLIQCSELLADDRIRKAAGIKLDQRMVAITSRELVAAEGHYHRSCY